MLTNKEKIVEKIRKLLALASSPNENEAMSAMEKAQTLLAEHNLNESDVKEEVSKIIIKMTKTDSVPWKRTIAHALASLYFCDYWYGFNYKRNPNRAEGHTRYDDHKFVGKEHNVDVAIMMFQYLIEAVERLANVGAKKQPYGKNQYLTSFRKTAAGTLSARLRERLRAARAGEVKSSTTGTTLPALAPLYDQAMAEIKPYVPTTLGKSRASIAPSSGAGVIDGRTAGETISIDSQIGGGLKQYQRIS